MSERIQKLLEKTKGKPTISMNIYRIIQNTYREMSGEPLVKCRAQAIYNILTKIPLYIEEGDLLAGNPGSVPGGLEIDSANGIWNESEIQDLYRDGYGFNKEDEPELYELNRTNTPYSMNDGVAEALEENGAIMPFLHSGMGMVRWTSLERGRQIMQCSAQGGLNLTPAQAMMILDYETALSRGIEDMIRDCDERIKGIRFFSKEEYDKAVYLKAMRTTLQGLLIYGKRLSDLAAQEAEKTEDAARKAELLQMSEILKQVPAKPARTFREALQMYWLLFHTVACPNSVLGMGRLDQILYPYYQHDIQEGIITDEEVLELFELLRVKDYQLGVVTGKDCRDTSNGEAKWHNIVIGGVKKDGSDATNELSYLILKSIRGVQTPHPTVSVRVADSTPVELILEGLKCVRAGCSMPAFLGDRSYIEYLLRNGVSEEEARNYAVAGCIDVVLPGKSRIMSACMFITPMCLDVFLNHGINRNLGEQMGHDPGDLNQWKSYGEFEAAFKEEFKYFISMMAEYSNLMICSMQEHFPEPGKTPFMYRGIEDGIDFQKKKMVFENGGVICPVGIVNLGNSLYAIKKLVYEEQKLTLNELKEIMDQNWEGQEELRKYCLELPKYGNDCDEVDQMISDMYQYFDEACREMPCATGTIYRGSAVSIFGHAPGGSLTGATPDGRLAGETLADAGASPMRGTDMEGPLSVIRSAIKLPQDDYQAMLFNMKFSKATMSNDADLGKLAALIQTYFFHNGKHIQFNMVDRQTLLDAREHPENHRDLLVRVAGYSAYYVELTERLQVEILERTQNDEIR
ncbi:MAG: hypothetical protein HUJ72_04620 [Blautia sp.]|nr:hypothetical protein [Blautia sp.]